MQKGQIYISINPVDVHGLLAAVFKLGFEMTPKKCVMLCGTNPNSARTLCIVNTSTSEVMQDRVSLTLYSYTARVGIFDTGWKHHLLIEA